MENKGAIVIEGHVQGLSNTRSLGELGIPVFVVDVRNCLARYSKYCTRFYRCPAFDSTEFIQFLIDLAQNNGISGWLILASNDHIVENLSHHKQELSLYYKMFVPSAERIDAITNKKQLLTIAQSCGVKIPNTCYVESIECARAFRYPALVKGNHGLSFYKTFHTKAFVVDSYQDLVSKVNEISSLIDTSEIMIQEKIPYLKDDGVISFTCFAINGEIRTFWMGRKIREHPIINGTGTMAQSVFDPRVLVEAKPLVRELNYSGVCEIEFMFDRRDDMYNLIEINPRTWLWVGLAKACGIDYPQLMYNYLNDASISYPREYPVGVKWINRITDTVYSIQAIIKKQLSIQEYISSFKGKIISAVWSNTDILPGLIFPFMIFSIAKNRR